MGKYGRTGKRADHGQHTDPGTAEPLLTPAQAAARLGVDVHTVRRWIRHEDCPTVRIGRKIRIPAAWANNPEGWLK